MYGTAPPALQALIQSTSGPLGLAVVLVYSFLVAIALPFPGEVVLAMPLDLGLHPQAELALLIATSAFGKAMGSLIALRLGNGASRSPLFARIVGQFPALAAGERAFVDRIKEYGYLGLAVGLAIPLMPDTALIYAFSVVETNYVKFAVAAFVGTAARLVTVAGLVNSALAVT
ncbi:hypothetical protein [Halomarina litorea]|uniref:hypothetical protein n=1 Tax=Halomarina litorea TaxID=2961595 RepID=UPI0020C3DDE9|nr:hypothetical protein [Halomarina sp. BCD28]